MAQMRDRKRVVLAYSGGVDTTACIPYLRHEMGCDYIVAMTADLGQGDELEPIRQKALVAGADEAVVIDAKSRFVEDFGFEALRANAVYDLHYPLSSALGRPLIGDLLVKTAAAFDCGSISHGATAKGNDQVRIELAVALLAPNLTILAPARTWKFNRSQTIAYSESFGIPSHVSKEAPWAIDLNVLGRNVEAGPIEDLEWAPTEEVWAMTVSPESAPACAEYVDIEFDSGCPVSLNGQRMTPFDLVSALNTKAGRHGVGRIDMLENRMVGIQSRELYEAPAMVVLLAAHEELENLVLTADVLEEKRRFGTVYAKLVYDGLWFGPLRAAVSAFIEQTQKAVNGRIRMKLYKGRASVVARNAAKPMYRRELATYGADSHFDQSSADGFITIFGLQSRVWSQLHGSGR